MNVEVVTWADVTTDDRIFLPDPTTGTPVVHQVARQGQRYAVRRAEGFPPFDWSEPRLIQPHLPVPRLYRGQTSAVLELLRSAGLAPDVLE